MISFVCLFLFSIFSLCFQDRLVASAVSSTAEFVLDKETQQNFRSMLNECCFSLTEQIMEALKIKKEEREVAMRLSVLKIKMHLVSHILPNGEYWLSKKTLKAEIDYIDSLVTRFRKLLHEEHENLLKAAQFNYDKVLNFIYLPRDIIIDLQGSLLEHEKQRFMRIALEENTIVQAALEVFRTELLLFFRRSLRKLCNDNSKVSADDPDLEVSFKTFFTTVDDTESDTVESKFEEIMENFNECVELAYNSFYSDLSEVIRQYNLHEETQKRKLRAIKNETNLFTAARKGDESEVQKFVSAGAHHGARENGLTAFDVALLNGHIKCARILYIPTLNRRVGSVHQYGEIPVKVILPPPSSQSELRKEENDDKKGSKDFPNPPSRNPWVSSGPGYRFFSKEKLSKLLIEKVRIGDADEVKLLIEEKADCNKMVEGKTLIELAYNLGHTRCAEILCPK